MKMLHHGWQSRIFVPTLFDRAPEAEMKSEFFSMFGIPPTECEIEARKDELGVPRL